MHGAELHRVLTPPSVLFSADTHAVLRALLLYFCNCAGANASRGCASRLHGTSVCNDHTRAVHFFIDRDSFVFTNRSMDAGFDNRLQTRCVWRLHPHRRRFAAGRRRVHVSRPASPKIPSGGAIKRYMPLLIRWTPHRIVTKRESLFQLTRHILNKAMHMPCTLDACQIADACSWPRSALL